MSFEHQNSAFSLRETTHNNSFSLRETILEMVEVRAKQDASAEGQDEGDTFIEPDKSLLSWNKANTEHNSPFSLREKVRMRG